MISQELISQEARRRRKLISRETRQRTEEWMISQEARRRIKELIQQEGQQKIKQVAVKGRQLGYRFQVWWSFISLCSCFLQLQPYLTLTVELHLQRVFNKVTWMWNQMKMPWVISAMKLYQNCLEVLSHLFCLMVIMCCCTFLTFRHFKHCNYDWLKFWSCAGETEFFTCSGIAVQRKGPVSGFLTSTSLVKALNDKIKNHGNLKVDAADHPLLIFLFNIHKLTRDHRLHFCFIIVDCSAPWRQCCHGIFGWIWFRPWHCYCQRQGLSWSWCCSFSKSDDISTPYQCCSFGPWQLWQIIIYTWGTEVWNRQSFPITYYVHL